eukprot:g3539.t1
MADVQVTSALNIMRRMPPKDIEDNLSGLLNLVPEHSDELLQRVDQPLQVATCPETGRAYILCDYNRDGDSYRSPWSNKYDPPIEEDDGFVPSDKLRQLEIQFNEVFDAYRNLYFEGGSSSVYLWDLPEGFAGCFLIQKDVAGQRFVSEGTWESIHVMEVKEQPGGKRATYKLTTTVMLSMKVDKDTIGDSNLSGSLTRQEERTCEITPERTHIVNMGKLIEDLEISMRSSMDGIYIQKTREVVNGIRKLHVGTPVQKSAFVADLSGAILKHGANRKVDSE